MNAAVSFGFGRGPEDALKVWSSLKNSANISPRRLLPVNSPENGWHGVWELEISAKILIQPTHFIHAETEIQEIQDPPKSYYLLFHLFTASIREWLRWEMNISLNDSSNYWVPITYSVLISEMRKYPKNLAFWAPDTAPSPVTRAWPLKFFLPARSTSKMCLLSILFSYLISWNLPFDLNHQNSKASVRSSCLHFCSSYHPHCCLSDLPEKNLMGYFPPLTKVH